MDLPTMRFIAEEFLPSQELKWHGCSLRTQCPECGRKTLTLNFRDNVFNCPCCDDVGGGCLDAWALFRGIRQSDKEALRKAAFADYCSYMENPQSLQRRPEKKILYSPDLKIADINVRNHTYRTLISRLTLRPEHLEQLKTRGFSDEEIARCEFKSVPRVRLQSIAEDLLRAGCTLEGVPGFYQYGKRWTFVKRASGIMIPVKDRDGRISLFQTRMDQGKPKYMTLSSSGKEKGTAGKTFVHYADRHYNSDSDFSKIVITEGPLKGDLVNQFLGIPVLCIMGVTATSYLKDELIRLRDKEGLAHVYVAFDMDFQKNDQVYRALVKLERMLEDLRIPHTRLLWDEKYKGLDDFLAAIM